MQIYKKYFFFNNQKLLVKSKSCLNIMQYNTKLLFFNLYVKGLFGT